MYEIVKHALRQYPQQQQFVIPNAFVIQHERIAKRNNFPLCGISSKETWLYKIFSSDAAFEHTKDLSELKYDAYYSFKFEGRTIRVVRRSNLAEGDYGDYSLETPAINLMQLVNAPKVTSQQIKAIADKILSYPKEQLFATTQAEEQVFSDFGYDAECKHIVYDSVLRSPNPTIDYLLHMSDQSVGARKACLYGYNIHIFKTRDEADGNYVWLDDLV